jgi:sulfate permease, SulP family
VAAGCRLQVQPGAFIVIVFTILSQYGFDGLLISTILAGFLLIIFGLLRLGTLLKYFPHPLIVGFTSGIAVVIFSTQIKDALGMEISEVPAGFIAKWSTYFDNLSTVNIYAVVITIATMLLVIFTKHLVKKVPGSIIAIILGTAVFRFSIFR